MAATYDRIGTSYRQTRRPDPRIAHQIHAALGDAASVVNVGAGTGSYEPTDRPVVAVEPSQVMVDQRPPDAAPVLMATADALPLRTDAVDAALAILTMHHWPDRARGTSELRRVARRRIVVLTWDQAVWERFWLISEYLPAIRDLDRPRAVDVERLAGDLGGADIIAVPVPHDCVDGFHGAFWRRPEAYLDPVVRSGMSTYSLMAEDVLREGLARLADDLDSGAWAERHADLLEAEEIDLGYRLIVAEVG